jgi:hypothetical protein
VLRAGRGGEGDRRDRLRLQRRAGCDAEAGRFGLLRVSAMHHPHRTCVEQREDELVVQSCGSLNEGGGSVYIHAASPVVHRLAALARIDRMVPGAWEKRVAEGPLCAAPCPRVDALRR